MQAESAKLQNKRRERFYRLYLDRMFDAIDDDAGWHGHGPTANLREKLWHCLPLLHAGGIYADRANRIINSLDMRKCHFSPMTAMQMLLKHPESLSGPSKMKLQVYVREQLEWSSGDGVHFTMYNDNFAALAAFTLLAAGEYFGKPQIFAAGTRKLMQLKEVFTRRGTLMEYGSPTYTPITAFVLAEIFNHIKDLAARQLALECEQRMWAEIAIHYHPPTSQFAGPYSRAYLVDSVGHPHLIHGFLYLAFGHQVFTNPVDTLFPARERQVEHVGAETLMLPNLAWLMSGDSHCSEELAALLLNKKYPFDAVATTECLPGTESAYAGDAGEHAAWSGPNTVYMTEDFALGTSCGQFYDGAISDSFHVVYRTVCPASRLEETRAVFCKYMFNDRQPGEPNRYGGNEASGPEMLRDEGRKAVLQHRDCALVVYRPKPYEAVSATSMKLSILFPVHFNEPEEIWIGGRKLDGLQGLSVDPVPVFVKDGPVYFGFQPLRLTDLGRQAAVKIERSGCFLLISFYNYEGPSRSFSRSDAELAANGFVAQVKQASDFESFAAFRRYAENGQYEDRTTCQLDGYTRWIRYEHPDIRLSFAYSPRSEGILYATVNGVPREEPLFRATGLNGGDLPFVQVKKQQLEA